jgi:hypothetical protein
MEEDQKQMEGNLIKKSGRQPQKKWKITFKKKEYDLKKNNKWKTNSTKIKEEDLKKKKIEDDLKKHENR